MIRKLFRWIFQAEIAQLEKLQIETLSMNETLKFQVHQIMEHNNQVKQLLGKCDVSVDVHMRHVPSWAVISIQGKKADYIKFIDLGHRDVVDIAHFLRRYERLSNIKIDAAPQVSDFLKISKK